MHNFIIRFTPGSMVGSRNLYPQKGMNSLGLERKSDEI